MGEGVKRRRSGRRIYRLRQTYNYVGFLELGV